MEIDPTQAKRILNLRVLNALVPMYGSTTSQGLYNFLKKKKVNITKTNISLFYRGERKISESEARAIESAFEMLPGWMDRDILKLFSLEDKDVKLIDSISKTEDKWKKLIIQLIDNI